MRSRLQSELYELRTNRNTDEKLLQADGLIKELINHFYDKAAKSKRFYQIYKYSSIVLAALTSIISSLQVIYSSSFPQWILPVASAGATVAVAFLGASSAQKIWINSRTTQQRFQTEQFLFNQNAGIYHHLSKEESIKKLAERMIELWNEGHGRWEQTVGND